MCTANPAKPRQAVRASEAGETSHGQPTEGSGSGSARSPDNAHTMGRHVAAHLRTLVLSIIRLAAIYDARGEDTSTDADSVSVSSTDTALALSEEPNPDPAADSVPAEDTEILDATEEAAEAAGVPQNHLVVPDAVVDFDGVWRKHDGVRAEEDALLEGLIKSGAFQAHLQAPDENTSRNKRKEKEGPQLAAKRRGGCRRN